MRLSRTLCILALFAVPALASTPQFNPRQDINTNFQHLTGLAVGDFNGDGKPDIAVTDSAQKQVVVYLNSGNGSFSSPITTPIQMGALGAGAIVVGDFNEDRKLDLIVGTIAGSQANIFLSGNGDGTFTQGQTLPGSFGFFSAAVADINHDSHLDLIAGGNGTLYVYLGDGHGNFTAQPFTNQGPSDAFFSVVAGDFNNDGKIDFVATAYNSNALRYFAGNGDGSFAAPSVLSNNGFSNPRFLASADFNGDGKLDLLLGYPDVAVRIFGDGDGTFQLFNLLLLPTPPPISPFPTTAGAPVVAAADMDGDGKIDAVVADSASNSMNVILNGGGSGGVPDFTASLPAAYNQMQIADLNGDGLPDIIATNYITQNISIFLSIKPKLSPAITLSSSSPSTFATSSISMTAKVAGSSSIVPTGIVTLMDGSTSLGQQALDTNGQAIFTLSNLSVGVHPFTAVYAGDTNYNSVTSDFVSPIITDMHIASTTASQTVTAGASASYSFTVIPDAGLTGTVTFTCSQLPPLATCDPVTVTLNARPVDTTLTVRTTAPLRSQNSTSHYALALLPLFAVCCVRRRRLLTPLLGITLICTLGFFATGCSSSKSSTTTPGTPSGSTQFTVTASITSGGQTLTRTTSATLVVQ
jgi:Bacterial Ig-like domain (group 3)/FG-GAP-like repeat